MTEPVQAQPPKPEPPKKKAEIDTIDQLQKLLDKMTPEERVRLHGLGVVIPEGDVSEALRGHYKFGVRCTECNKIALCFVGDEWTLEDGTKVDLPPPWPHQKIAWTQPLLHPSQINRNSPKCQHCGCKVPTEGASQFRRDRGRIVEITLFEGSRDRAYNRKALNDFKKQQATGGAGQIEVAPNYNKKDAPVSSVIAEQRGGEGALKEIEHLADVTGVTEQLRRGFK